MDMKRWLMAALGSLCIGLANAASWPSPPEVGAKAYLLFDMKANQVLASRDADQPVEPASLTKLMTAYLVFDALKNKRIALDQTLTISVRAWKMQGSRMFIEPNWQVPVEDLIKGMIVQSGNDATVALAEGVGGTVEQFVELMNQQAKALGMNNTTYRNPEGMPAEGHMTTAQDLATLASRLYSDFPEYVGYYAIQRYHYPGTPKANDMNRNLLLYRDPTVDGLKTGHTQAAGYCLVATAKRSVPGAPGEERRLLSVVLGASSALARAAESQKLLNWGYAAFRVARVPKDGDVLAKPQVWFGATDVAELGVQGGMWVAAPQVGSVPLRTRLDHPKQLKAPLEAGATVGKVEVLWGDSDRVLGSGDLQVIQAVPEAGIMKRLWHHLLLSLD
jgi:D-alanyl-D-alanine carboxypeptidase (penicillin-binding protein 5/6)